MHEILAQAQPINGSIKLGNYLKRLRTGYGYSLRRVEEKARISGGDIDNSQLSRYEKGVCYPSFDKLRVLASVFNVSIQSFSDIIDLEEHDVVAPPYDTPELAMKAGHEELNLGSFGKAYACFEQAIERLTETLGESGPDERLGRARLFKAIALHKLGKLSLSEQELRLVLRFRTGLSQPLMARVLLQLSNIHVELGDAYLGILEAQQALDMARVSADRECEAMALHGIGRIADEEGRADDAIASFRDALRIHEERGNKHEALTLRANLACQYIARGKTREGTRLMAQTIEESRAAGFRRQLAYAYTKLAEAHYKTRQVEQARRFAEESDVVAGAGPVKYVDILFQNSFYLWKIAMADGNQTQERIAFGRLKYLRPSLERVSPEVADFDAFIEKKKGRLS
jgi:transcriptional regulator with XRE-family HTH domain